jgi:hypothetical protein
MVNNLIQTIRVETTINEVQFFSKAKVLRNVIYDQSDPLPDGAYFTIADGATEPAIHIQLAAKFTVDKEPYSGNCTLCGERRHDKAHCYEIL